MAESTTPAGYNYTCNECGASFEAMEDLTEHCRYDRIQSRNKVHNGSRSEEIYCGIYKGRVSIGTVFLKSSSYKLRESIIGNLTE